MNLTFAYSRVEPAVLVRVIGLTGDSTNIGFLLRSLCLQLCHVYNSDPSNIPHDFKGLFNNFSYRLSLASAEKPVVIYLVSLHKLSDENDARMLAWLPRELPPHVRLVVSTLSEDKYECFSALKKNLLSNTPANNDKEEEIFIEVPEISVKDAMAMLDHWYHREQRNVTEDQRSLLVKSFSSCPTPLYLRVIFNESLRWTSLQDAKDIKLGSAVKNVVTVMLGRLEKNHGEPFVRRALGYICASRNGVTENELEDLLSLDEAVMDDVCSSLKLDIRRFPTILLLRLRHEIGEYLDESSADNCLTLTWQHEQFQEAASDRYLDNRDKAPSYHKAFVEYFLDTWSTKPKPYAGNDKGVLRFVTPQPIYWERSDSDDRDRIYNLRKLNEQPYHLVKSQQHTILKSHCLCNFEFVLAKLSATTLRSVLEDIQLALAGEPGDGDLNLLSDTLHLSAPALHKDPRQLASQVIGRLHDIIITDLPVSPGDPVKYPVMKQFHRQAQNGSVAAILPSSTCLTSPGGILSEFLSGHTKPITAVVISTDGRRALTTSKDDTMKLWELKTGRVLKTLAGVGANVFQLRLSGSSKMAVTSEATQIRVWNLDSGECMKEIQSDDPASITIANDGKTLVAFMHGAAFVKCWDLSGEFALTFEANLSDVDEKQLSECFHKDHTTVVAAVSVGPWVLHAFKDSSYAMVRNVNTGNLVHRLQCKPSGSITAVSVSREYFVCAVRYLHSKHHEIFYLELFEVANGHHCRSIKGCVLDNVDELHINTVGSHAFAVCYSEAKNSSELAVWNLETEEHKHFAKHAGVSRHAACADLSCVLTASTTENSLRVWNMVGKVNQPVPKEKPKEGIEEIVPLRAHPRYALVRSINNGPLVLWNVIKKKFAGCVVRSERGLTESSDIVLPNNTKLIILTDKGFSAASGEGQPVYQTVMTYDLIRKKCTRKLTGCYIVPSPRHEYVILNDENLMGLSENRRHFVVWSLVTGHILYRIKTNFREKDRMMAEVAVTERSEASDTRRQSSAARKSPRKTRSGRRRKPQAETEEEKQKLTELRKEKDNAIEEFLISKDYSTIVASFYARHLCVFDVASQSHTQTLECPTSMMLLHVAALSSSGDFLVHVNYDESDKNSYITCWECKSGYVRKRLRNEKNVYAIAISDDAQRVVYGNARKELRIWEPLKRSSLRKIKGYASLEFVVGSQIHIVDGGHKAVVYAGDISMWDLENACVLAVFTPDMKIQSFSMALEGQLILLGLRDRPELVSLRLAVRDAPTLEPPGQYLFDEVDSSDDDDDDNEEEQNEE